ncbi:hypothetical protein [Stutzerimonas marianensis]
MTDNGLRDARDREKKYLTELIETLNNTFARTTDTDQAGPRRSRLGETTRRQRGDGPGAEQHHGTGYQG